MKGAHKQTDICTCISYQCCKSTCISYMYIARVPAYPINVARPGCRDTGLARRGAMLNLGVLYARRRRSCKSTCISYQCCKSTWYHNNVTRAPTYHNNVTIAHTYHTSVAREPAWHINFSRVLLDVPFTQVQNTIIIRAPAYPYQVSRAPIYILKYSDIYSYKYKCLL